MAVCLSNTGIVFSSGQTMAKAPEVTEFYVYGTNHWAVTNGGRCCLWNVPNGTNSIKFEILSGGGPGGSSGGDYDFGIGGQGGNYDRRK